MSKIDSVVVVFDFSDDAAHAVRRAAAIAAEHGARLRLLHVVKQSVLEPLREWFGSKSRADAVLAERWEAVRNLAGATAKEYSVNVEPIIRHGHAVEEVLRASDRADLLVVGARSDPLEDFLRGTLAARLMRKWRRPLLIVKMPAQRPYQRVLVPVDLSGRSPAALRLALRMAPRAAVHVMHAYEAVYEGLLRRASVSEREIRRHRALAKSQAKWAMQLLRDPLRADSHRIRVTVEHGHGLLRSIQRQASLAAELVVLSPRHRPAYVQMLFGSMTRDFLERDLPTDVLIMPEQAPKKERRLSAPRRRRALAG
jgi:nucleotide-binding universal stress UspA family protein